MLGLLMGKCFQFVRVICYQIMAVYYCFTFLLQIFDPENQGHITLESLLLILHNAFSMTEVDVEELFNQVDADQDGIISFGRLKHRQREAGAKHLSCAVWKNASRAHVSSEGPDQPVHLCSAFAVCLQTNWYSDITSFTLIFWQTGLS